MSDETKANLKRFTTNWFILSCFLGTFGVYVLFCLVGIQSGFIPTSEGNGTGGPPTKWALHVQENGQAFYANVEEGARAVTEEFAGDLLGSRHTDPRVFLDADDAIAFVTGPLPGNVAYAHYGYVCWNRNYSIEWNRTASSKHVTWHRKDYQGRRYTTTAHKTLSGGYWVTTDLFKTSVPLSSC